MNIAFNNLFMTNHIEQKRTKYIAIDMMEVYLYDLITDELVIYYSCCSNFNFLSNLFRAQHEKDIRV